MTGQVITFAKSDDIIKILFLSYRCKWKKVVWLPKRIFLYLKYNFLFLPPVYESMSSDAMFLTFSGYNDDWLRY